MITTEPGSRVPLLRAVLLLGFGLGGFLDGIVLHQLLQWHQMVSLDVPPVTIAAKNYNMFWDGVFHAGCWLATLAGVVLLWQAGRRGAVYHWGTTALLWGGLLIGWGVFNLIEGILDHQVFRIHSVRDASPAREVWNWGFLIVSLAQIGFGIWWIRRRK